jgi:hypothetical protein
MSSFTEIIIYNLLEQKFNPITKVTIDLEPKIISLAQNLLAIAGANQA